MFDHNFDSCRDRPAMNAAIQSVVAQDFRISGDHVTSATLSEFEKSGKKVRYNPYDDTYVVTCGVFTDPKKHDILGDGAIDLNDVDGMI